MVEARQVSNVVGHSMPALTGLRGLCALWVLLYHAWVYVTPEAINVSVFDQEIRLHVFLSLGWSGVQILFVLSAFLLTTPYARASAGLAPQPRLMGYLLRRFARVFPAFHIQLLLLIVVAWLFYDQLIVTLAQLPQYLLMLFMPPPIGIGSPTSINGIWWTLPIELSFYLLLPLIAGLAAWNRKWLLLGLCLVVTCSWRWYVLDVINPADKHLWVTQLPGSMDSFGMGMLGAIIHVHFTQVRQQSNMYGKVLGWLLLSTPFIFFGLGHWMAEAFESYWTLSLIMFTWTPVFNAAVVILILNCAHNQASLTRLFGNRWVFYLGTVSYGLYLWHAPIGNWLLNSPWIAQMEGYQFPRLALSMFFCSMLAATLSWFLVEKKVIGLARNVS